MHMKNNSKWLAAALSVVAVLLINWVSGLEFFRIDLTEGKVYTLSDGTKQILKNLDEPVTLRFYVSQGDDNMPLPLKGYARRVEDLLREFKAASKGKLGCRRYGQFRRGSTAEFKYGRAFLLWFSGKER